jgi:hypothetical protein
MANGELDSRFAREILFVQNNKKRSKGDEMINTKQEVLNALSRLYRLQEEGKKVDCLIAEYEELLFRLTDDELDEEKTDEEN